MGTRINVSVTILDHRLFFIFLAAACVLAITPGPGIFYVLTRTLAGGTREGISFSFGTFLGGFVHVVAAALGLSAILATSATAGYSQVVEVRGGRTLYISGQVALDSSGDVVGVTDFTAQVKQVFANLKARLDEAGASFNDVVKLNFYLLDAGNLQIVRDVRDTYVNREHPPASTLVVVKQLVRTELMVEVEAIAVTKD